MHKEIKVGLLGLGTVGTGVMRIVEDHEEKISQVIGKKLRISKVLVRDLDKHQNRDLKVTLTDNFSDILEDETIQMVVEVMGSVEIAREYIKQSLSAGKHVVTANKDLIAQYGNELMKLAHDNKCDLYYEGSVAGGIPILRTLVNSMASDQIQEVVGIVNGTTNFILTKMSDKGLSYHEALTQAQALGFAEADPSSDVDGLDAARKMVILTRLSFGMNIDLEDISTRGIRQLDLLDITYAKEIGYRIKLLGLAKKVDDKIYVEVGPALVPENHPLASVHNENNAVFVVGAAVGETMYYGAGAGELPTANSVVSDMINISKNMMLQTTGNVFNSYTQEKSLLSKDDIAFSYYYRIKIIDKPGMFLELTKIFLTCGISFERIKQEQVSDGYANVMITTHPMPVSKHNQFESLISQHAAIEVGVSLRLMHHKK